MEYVRPNYNGTPVETYNFDVNISADGDYCAYGHDNVTFDVYINGSKVANDVKDFSGDYAKGTTYTVNDISVSGNYVNTGSNSYSGTINDSVNVIISIESIRIYFDVNVKENGYPYNSGHDAVTFDVYLNGSRVADDVKDFCGEYAKGTRYEVKDIRVSGCYRNTGSSTYSGTLNSEVNVIIPIEESHSYGAWTKLNDTHHQRVCSRDSSHKETAVHTWNAGVITTPATCQAIGVKTFTCTACGATRTQNIAQLSHVDADTDYICDTCGQGLPYIDMAVQSVTDDSVFVAVRLHYCADFEEGKLIISYDNELLEYKNTKRGKDLNYVLSEFSYLPQNVILSAHDAELNIDFNCLDTLSDAVNNAVEEDPSIASVIHADHFEAFIIQFNRRNGNKDIQTLLSAAVEDVTFKTNTDLGVKDLVINTSQDPHPEQPHVWDAGTVTASATCQSGGTKEFSCTICGETKNEHIMQLPHTDKNKDSVCDVCGREVYFIDLKPIKTTDDEIKIALNLNQCIGLISADLKLFYDENALTAKSVKAGKDANLTYGCRYNNYSALANTVTPGIIKYSFNLFEGMADKYTYDHAANPEGSVDINTDVFEAAVITFQKADTTLAQTTTITITVVASDGPTDYVLTAKDLVLNAAPTCSHRWGEWITTILPTAKNEGKQVSTCSICGQEKEMAIPALDMVLAPGIIDGGYLGDSIVWSMDANGNVTVAGTGKMYNFNRTYFFDEETETDQLGLLSPFYQNEDVKTVTIENGVSNISPYLCWGCKNLETLTVAESVTTIGGSAFQLCTQLNTISLPEKLRVIDHYAFSACESLTDINLPEGLGFIGIDAFGGTGIHSIIIPKTVTEICAYAFSYCENLKEISLSDKITYIGEHLFWNCTALEKIVLPKSIKRIEVEGFSGCTSLKEIWMYDGIYQVDEYAFYECDQLKTVYFNGTASEWNSINILEGNEALSNARLICNSAYSVDPPVDPDAVLTVASVNAQPGKTVTVDVDLSKAAPMSYLRVTLDYDTSVLTLTNVKNGGLFDSFDSGASYVLSADADVETTGRLLTLTFAVSEAAEAGEYAVTVLAKECYNYEEAPVTVGVEPGKVTVRAFVAGDANGDGEIDGRDVIRLRKYLANLNEATGESTVEISAGADCTGDGVVDGRDLIRLRKYLANLDESTGVSTVTLG